MIWGFEGLGFQAPLQSFSETVFGPSPRLRLFVASANSYPNRILGGSVMGVWNGWAKGLLGRGTKESSKGRLRLGKQGLRLWNPVLRQCNKPFAPTLSALLRSCVVHLQRWTSGAGCRRTELVC